MLRQKLPEKLVKRYRLAQRNAGRKAVRKKAFKIDAERKNKGRELHHQRMIYTEQLVAARKARQEDWALGPLAPRRDLVGDKATPYGALEQIQISEIERIENTKRAFIERFWSPEKKMEKHGWRRVDAENIPGGVRVEGATAWEKKGQYFLTNDRVVIIRGPNVGKVGDITSINRISNTAHLKEINMAEIPMPKWMPMYESTNNGLRATDVPIPLEDIRLVATFTKRIKDPETEEMSEVVEQGIVDHMILRTTLRPKRGIGWIYRFVPGSEWLIHGEETQKKEKKDEEYGPDDTLRITTEEVSFVPSLISVPMPVTVIDELRNPYGRLRRRHSDEYIEKVEAKEEAKRQKERSVAVMKTPLNEFNALGKVALKAEVKRRIEERGSDEKIGEAVWKHLAAAAAKQNQESRPRL